MPTFKEIVEVKDRAWNRAVKVTITAPTLGRRRSEPCAKGLALTYKEDR